jgi:plasmid stabilization system protein ParE
VDVIDEIIWTQGATADLQSVYSWLEDGGEGRGEALLELVDSSLALLRQFPEMATRYSGNLRRRLVGNRREYGLFYEVAGRRIVVAAFLDLRQDPEKLKEILKERGTVS